MRTAPLSLSDRQLALVRNAARAVPVSARDLFLQNVARHLPANRPTSPSPRRSTTYWIASQFS
jgi:hypothetical protein